jgi:hypothetical protein
VENPSKCKLPVEKELVFPQVFPQLVVYTTFFEKGYGKFSTTSTNMTIKKAIMFFWLQMYDFGLSTASFNK